MSKVKKEVWLRGPIPEVPAMLQPVAHALLQAREEVHEALAGFCGSGQENARVQQRLWARPAGVASVGFHLKHLRGVLDRMATYASAKPLSQSQLNDLADEQSERGSATALLAAFDLAVDDFVLQLKGTDPSTLTEVRTVGRQQLPSTLIGILVHAAEHTTRHTGQLIVTARMVDPS